jgi:hypothetical protein
MGSIVLKVLAQGVRALFVRGIGLRLDADVLAWLGLLSSSSFPPHSFAGGRP